MLGLWSLVSSEARDTSWSLIIMECRPQQGVFGFCIEEYTELFKVEVKDRGF